MSLPIPRLVFVLALTSLYLLFELGFNARLLDLVGGEADPADIDRLEFFGRFLSGCAVALFAVGYYYKRLVLIRGVNNWGLRTDGVFLAIVATSLFCAFLCVIFLNGRIHYHIHSLVILLVMIFSLLSLRRLESLAGIAIPLFLCVNCTYFLLERLTNTIVDNQTDSQRQIAVQTVLLQKGLLSKQITLDSIDMRVFGEAQGRAFMATFPLMAMNIVNLESKIHAAKKNIVEKAVRDRIGSPQTVYDKQYTPAIKSVQDLWVKYSAGNTPFDVDAETEKQFARAWGDYRQSLSRHRWTPETIPGYAKSRVVSDVRKNVAVPSNWNPSDADTFKRAIRSSLERKAYSNDGALRVDGERIAPGLGFDEFVKQSPIQKRLKSSLRLPASIRVQAAYANTDEFISTYYKPLVKYHLSLELIKYEAPVEMFAEGKELYLNGIHAVRKTLVPTIALLFSLLGAVSHAAKFLMIIATAVVESFVRPRRFIGPAIWSSLVGASCVALLHMENGVTSSELYRNIEKQALTADSSLSRRITIDALHVINVGQGYGYPYFESIRLNVLGGLDYGFAGYDSDKK